MHKAATYPTFDPTWYGPEVVVLGMMEVNAASVCACVPVFWPVLTARIDQIFVTQEVKITRECRYSGDGDDQIELHNSATSMHSRAESLSSHSQMGLTQKTAHYTDEFMMEKVNPIRSQTTVQASKRSAPKGV